VIANTGDDIDIHGAYVSPDPDLVTFWLADRIDARGWGLEGDTFNVMDGLRELGEDVWFNLGDRDLAIGLKRREALDAGERLTRFHGRLGATLGLGASVLPMSDQPVRTRVLAGGRWWPLQEFLIRCEDKTVADVEFKGAAGARATDEALAAIAAASAIVIGPSNPIISIGPILALDDLRAALADAQAPVVAVSPIVAGTVLKGPTAEFLAWRGVPASGEGVARIYEDLIDGIVCDDPVSAVPSMRTELLMDGPAGRRRLAEETLRFAMGLAGPLAGQPAGGSVHPS
jgi:LPPG:FO 2-phospho-L-lactate transferase